MRLKHRITPEVKSARTLLIERGWSVRRAHKELGCSFTHLAHVLTGRRVSNRLLRRIMSLPESPVPRRESGFAISQ